MTVFRRFEKGDVYDSIVVASPAWELASGSSGWRIQGGVSSSVNVFPGLRSRPGTADISIRPIGESRIATDGAYFVTGSYPLSASLRFVTARPEAGTEGQQDWKEAHWAPLQLLYEYHGRRTPNAVYQTGSNDFYCMFFRGGSRNIVAASGSDSAAWATISSSFCLEFWIKPFVTSSNTDDYTIASRRGSFYLGISGSNGRLVFSGSTAGIVTSSIGPDARRWSHVVVRGQNGTGSFKVDLADAGTFSYTSLASPASASFSIGNVFSAPTNGTVEYFSGQEPSGSSNRSFFGLIHEGRVWSTYRSDAQLSSSYDRVMHASSSQSGLVSYVRFNQGPLARIGALTAGSGAQDHSSRAEHLTLGSFARKGPVWHPCDNPDFRATVAAARQDISVPHWLVINVPSLMHGRQIATGSVSLTCRAFSSGTTGIVRTLVDDGYGGLYISGSICSSSLADKESYKGVDFNRVGNVFYGEGLIVIKDPALLDFGWSQGETVHPNDILQVSMRGTSWIPTKVLSCRMPAGAYNASQNPTFARLQDDGKRHLVRDEGGPVTYATTVGLYDSKKRLVAVARLVQPLRKRERDKPTVRLRFDF